MFVAWLAQGVEIVRWVKQGRTLPAAVFKPAGVAAQHRFGMFAGTAALGLVCAAERSAKFRVADALCTPRAWR